MDSKKKSILAVSLLLALVARPVPANEVGCYYYWVNERVDPEGVKKDLQWMKSVGITKAFLATDIRNRFRVEDPWAGQEFGPNEFMSEHWWKCLETALVTAGELGIEMGIFNCPGWSQSGGPWVKPEEAMRYWDVEKGAPALCQDPAGGPLCNSPCSPKATGLEVDKLNRKHVRKHFDSFIGEILRRIPAEKRKTLTTVVIDSWERGNKQNYTDGIFEKFEQRFGYNLDYADPKCQKDLQWLISDLVATEYMGELTRCAHEHGLKTWCEPYAHGSPFPGNAIDYGAQADMVAAEFWVHDRKYRDREMRNALGAAKKKGAKRVYAESFTDGNWKTHAKDDWTFEALKPIADKYHAAGVTDFILHVVISQPGDDNAPPVRPWFGSFFDRRSKHAGEVKTLVDYLKSLGENVRHEAQWLAVPDAPVLTGQDRKDQIAAPGTSWFVGKVTNAAEVASAKWTTAGLGVYELYVNGRRVGDADALKPGFTHARKTKRSFTYDVAPFLDRASGAANVLAAEVSSGWWRDRIVGYAGKKSAFRSVLDVTYADGTASRFVTDTNSWTCAVGGPVRRAGIFDGEIYDARIPAPVLGGADFKVPEISTEFRGAILPSDGAEVCRRDDLALSPVEAYGWKGTTGTASNVFGKAVKTRTFDPKGELAVAAGETLVIDFGQNCAAVPSFAFTAKPGVTLTCLPGEMLNDANGECSRGNDGPGDSLYRANLRMPKTGMRLEYTFATDREETYMPRMTFFGYRYLSITATDAVTIRSVRSIPVTSVRKELETGRIEVGEPSLNRFIRNVYWGQLSNYLSVPTDCPQRNERLGWMADTQVFCEAGSFNADTRGFFRKYARDMRDSQGGDGGYPSVSPYAQYGNDMCKFGWADAGVIVPWTVWRQYGDVAIVAENYEAMAKFVRKIDAAKYDFDGKGGYLYADWLSYEKYETWGGWKRWKLHPDAIAYRRYLAACYWLYDAELMVEMATALGKAEDASWFADSAKRARAHIRSTYLEGDGMLLKVMRDMQTASVFALKFGIVEGEARAATKAILIDSIRAHGGCLRTGFLGTSFLMDVLAQEEEWQTAYDLLFQHKCPSWLHSVDQGATTVWERWNSYTKDRGFGPVGMNSFNHYAYGAVLAWIYKHAAGIAADPKAPGFKTLVLRPIPDRRLGFVKAEYKSAAGLIKSAWRYEGDQWIWDFTVPEGVVARVTLPGENEENPYAAGTHHVSKVITDAASNSAAATPFVAKWRGNRAAAVSFTFDDGLRDQYELAFPKMKELGIGGTFFLNGGSIESQKPTRQGALRMTWDMVKEMSDAGMEMSNHGLNHANHGRTPRDAVEVDIASNDVLIASHTGKRPITYAYPNNAKNKEWSATVVNAGRVGARTHQTSFGGKHTVESGRKLFAKAKADRSWLVLMTHAVKHGYDQWRDPEMFYTLLADAAHDKDLWIDTFAAVAIYERLRDETKIAVTRNVKGWHIAVAPPALDKNLFVGMLDLVMPDGTVHSFDPFGGDFDIAEEN